MKLLWIKSDFLHPTTKGGQIRTLEMLRRLHRRHEVHYVALDDGRSPEGVARSHEYCSRAYPVPHTVAPRRSARFAWELALGLVGTTPVSIRRYESRQMRDLVSRLMESERFDCTVCDFLTPAVNLPNVADAVIFQHNVETLIWERHAQAARNPFARIYLKRQAQLMQAFEGRICRTAHGVVAVSETDATLIREMFHVRNVPWVPTGVDIEYFQAPGGSPHVADLIFVGSMDWLPNADGIRFFVDEVLPLIRRRRPECSLAIVGRNPGPDIRALARNDPHIVVTGTVPDVRPYLWGSAVAVVPLRVGSGTRLKIYEAMAAGTAVVSTTVGSEGLDVCPPTDIRIADTAADFAGACVRLLEDSADRERVSRAAVDTASRVSWDRVVERFERALADCQSPLAV